MNRLRQLFHLPPTRYWWLPLIVLAALGLILALAQSPLPAAIFYLLLLLSLAFILSRQPRPKTSHRPLLSLVLTVILTSTLPYLIDTSLRLSALSRRLPPDNLVDGVFYTWGHVVANNSLGFREREIITPKPHGTYRIMVLGDSMTWGVGVPVSDRYSNLLENLLNQNGPSPRFEVLNFATQAANTTDELSTLKKYIAQVDPDQIVIGSNFDDSDDSDQVVDPESRRLTNQYNKYIDPYFSKLRLYYLSGQFIKAIKQAAILTGYLPDQTVELQRQLAMQAANLPAWQQTLKEIINLSSSRGLPPPILVILERGLYTDRPTDYQNPEPALQAIIDQQTQAERTAHDLGLITQRHYAEIARELNSQILAVNSADHHPSTALHQLFARKLRDNVLANMSYDR